MDSTDNDPWSRSEASGSGSHFVGNLLDARLDRSEARSKKADRLRVYEAKQRPGRYDTRQTELHRFEGRVDTDERQNDGDRDDGPGNRVANRGDPRGKSCRSARSETRCVRDDHRTRNTENTDQQSEDYRVRKELPKALEQWRSPRAERFGSRP